MINKHQQAKLKVAQIIRSTQQWPNAVATLQLWGYRWNGNEWRQSEPNGGLYGVCQSCWLKAGEVHSVLNGKWVCMACDDIDEGKREN